MGIPSELRALYSTAIGSDNVAYDVFPAAAPTAAVSDGVVAAWAWSPYVQIVAAAAIPDPCWLVGAFLSTPVVEAFLADFAIATGAAAAEVDKFVFPFSNELFAVVEGKTYFAPVLVPIRLTGSPRLAVRIRKSSAASAAGASLKVQIATGLG